MLGCWDVGEEEAMETFEKCVRRHREASVQAHIPRHRHSDNCKLRLPLISRQIYVHIYLEKISLDGDKYIFLDASSMPNAQFYFLMRVC